MVIFVKLLHGEVLEGMPLYFCILKRHVYLCIIIQVLKVLTVLSGAMLKIIIVNF